MLATLLLTGVAIPFVITGFAHPKDSAVIKEVEAIEMKRFDAQVHKDYKYLEKVFSPDLIYIHSGGAVNTKEEYIQSIKDGKSVYEKIEVEEVRLRPYNKGNTVLVN